MPDILQEPGECLFFRRLLPLIPEDKRVAAAIRMARALSSHGMASQEWTGSAQLPPLLNDLAPYTGAAWLPAAIPAAPLDGSASLTNLQRALDRRREISERSIETLLAAAEEAWGTARESLLSLTGDVVLAAQIKGSLPDDEVLLARCEADILRAELLPAAGLIKVAAGVEHNCREMLQRHPADARTQYLLGRALYLRATRTSDSAAIPLLLEATRILGGADGDSVAARYEVACLLRLAWRSAVDVARALVDRALRRVESGDWTSPARTRARVEVLLGRVAFFGTNAEAVKRLRDMAAEFHPLVTSQPDVRNGLALARLLYALADREPTLDSPPAEASDTPRSGGGTAAKTFAEAADVLQSALIVNPDDYNCAFMLGDIYRRLAYFSRAEATPLLNDADGILTKAIKSDPDRPEAHWALLVVAEERANQDSGVNRARLIDEAWNSAARVLERFPGIGLLHRQAGRIRAAQARLPLSAASSRAASAAEAASHFSAAATLLPSEPGILENWGQVIVQQARDSWQRQAVAILPDAIAKFEAALSIRAGHKWALAGWASALSLQAENAGSAAEETRLSELAIAKFGEALVSDPTFHVALLGRAQVRIALSRLSTKDPALRHLEAARKDAELADRTRIDEAWAAEVPARVNLALAERRSDRMSLELIESGLDLARRGAELRSDDPWPAVRTGDLYKAKARLTFNQQDLLLALGAYAKVPKEAPRAYARAQAGIGWTQFEWTHGVRRGPKGDNHELIAYFELAREAFNNALETWSDNDAERGVALVLREVARLRPREIAAGLLDEAFKHLTVALERRPDDPWTLTGIGDVSRYRAEIVEEPARKLEGLSVAETNYQLARNSLADHFGAIFGMGQTAMARGRITGDREQLYSAVADFETALQVRPGDKNSQQRLEDAHARIAELLRQRPTKSA